MCKKKRPTALIGIWSTVAMFVIMQWLCVVVRLCAGIRELAALVREPAQAFEAFHAFVKPWHADHEYVAERFVAAWLRVEQFEIGSLAGQCGSKRQIVGLEEIVAAGHDEQWRQVDVERQAFGGEELRVGGFDAVEEFDAKHLFEAGAAVRIVTNGQLAAHGFQ